MRPERRPAGRPLPTRPPLGSRGAGTTVRAGRARPPPPGREQASKYPVWPATAPTTTDSRARHHLERAARSPARRPNPSASLPGPSARPRRRPRLRSALAPGRRRTGPTLTAPPPSGQQATSTTHPGPTPVSTRRASTAAGPRTGRHPAGRRLQGHTHRGRRPRGRRQGTMRPGLPATRRRSPVPGGRDRRQRVTSQQGELSPDLSPDRAGPPASSGTVRARLVRGTGRRPGRHRGRNGPPRQDRARSRPAPGRPLVPGPASTQPARGEPRRAVRARTGRPDPGAARPAADGRQRGRSPGPAGRRHPAGLARAPVAPARGRRRARRAARAGLARALSRRPASSRASPTWATRKGATRKGPSRIRASTIPARPACGTPAGSGASAAR